MTWLERLVRRLRAKVFKQAPVPSPDVHIPGSSQTARPKTYLYVSDAKVDMLTQGLSTPLLEQFDLKVTANVPALGGLEVSPRHRERGRYERAERLCKALDAQGMVGPAVGDSRFMRGTALAVWGFWNREDEGYADVVFFTAMLDDKTLLGLGGSAYHTMERGSDRLQQWSNSGLQSLLQFIKEKSESEARPKYAVLPGAWGHEMGDADHDNLGVPEEIEFVAERLLDNTKGSERWIVGSPIYVATTGRTLTSELLAEHAKNRDAYSLAHHQRLRLEPGPFGESALLGKYSAPVMAPLQDPDDGE